MKTNRAKPEKPGGEGRDWAPLEGLRQFIAARFVLSPHRAKNNARGACAPARPRAFSREVVRRHERLPVADTLGFLHSLFGRGRSGGELAGFRSDLIYREPGKTFHQSFYNWFVQSALSLTVNKLEQSFGIKLEQSFQIWLNQTYAPQNILNLEHSQTYAPRTALNLEHKSFPGARTHWQAATHEVFLRQSAPGGDAAARVIERNSRELHVRDAGRHGTQVFHLPPARQTPRDLSATHLVNTLREFESRFKATGVSATSQRERIVARVAGAAREFVLHVLYRLTAPHLTARDAAGEAGEVYVAVPPGTILDAALRTPVTLQHVRSASVLTRESARGWQGQGGTFSHTTVMPVSLSDSRTMVVPVGLSDSRTSGVPVRVADWFGQRSGAGFSLVKVETPRVSPAVSVVLKTGLSGGPWGADEDAPAPPLNRDLAARTTLAARTIRAYQPATRGRRHDPGGGFTFLRREDQLRPPTQSYAFAQPARPAPVEVPAVTQVREKEVEELVRKQVETAMKSSSPIAGLSRSDYSRLADHVYSSLARRLVIDKERSGLHR